MSFVIDIPVPSMGATVSELTIIAIAVTPGTPVAKGQKLAELESDKSSFEFESPAAGTVVEIKGAKGDVVKSGQPLFRMQTDDASVGHLKISEAASAVPGAGGAVAPSSASAGNAGAAPAASEKAPQWTPRALKLAQDGGLDPAKITDIVATGPGGRISGDDVVKYLADRK